MQRTTNSEFLPVKYAPDSHLERDQFQTTSTVVQQTGNLFCLEFQPPRDVFATTPPGMEPRHDLDQRAHLKRMEYLLGVFAARPDYLDYLVGSKRGALMWKLGWQEKHLQ